MKKAFCFILATALVLCLSVPAFATEYNETDTQGRMNLSFTYNEPPAPTYTVTIPASLDLSVGDNPFSVGVSDAENLGGKSVVITFHSSYNTLSIGEKYYPCLGPQFTTGSIYYQYIPFRIYDQNGVEPAVIWGSTLAQFDDNGTAELNIKIDLALLESYQPGKELKPGGTYSGYMTFGIALQ